MNPCLMVKHGGVSVRLPIDHDEAIVGSSESCDVLLTYDGVSRRHAQLVRASDGFHLIDLESKNGLLVDGARVHEVVLARGVEVQIGEAWVSLDEAVTGDLNFDSGRPRLTIRKRTTDVTETRDSGFNRSAALRLIASVETARAREKRYPLHAILDEARRALVGQSLFVMRGTAFDDLSLLGCAGTPPPEEVLAAAARALAAKKDDIRRVGDVSVITRPVDSTNKALVATFAGPPRVIHEDERAFLEYLTATQMRRSRPQVALTPLVFENQPHAILHTSEVMKTAIATATAYARGSRAVMLMGETGTGKELFARLIHERSSLSHGPFVAVNCASFAPGLIESELFGIEDGVATGVEARKGFFARADGGTLFLDEIGEMTDAAQAALLRILERNELIPVGARTPQPIRLRVVLATNRSLDASRIRADLFFRCHAMTLPPLRERAEDIDLLVHHFIERECVRHGYDPASISIRALEALRGHHWPGNVRELETDIEKLILFHGGMGVLQYEHLPAKIRTQASAPLPVVEVSPATLKSAERAFIVRALAETSGNVKKAAEHLGLSRNGLYSKMTRLGIE